ncbi:hypothetical protein GGS21DRAFT_349394 [Xylaria nigripes]|nr:hypothetical protein GGS21DRAFT_349394 [Xylaria nigripes]
MSTSTSTTQSTSRPVSRQASTCSFNPATDNPAAAERFVRNLVKKKPHNRSLAATELTPLFGFGRDARRDVLARMRTQAVFASREIVCPYAEFDARYTRGRWGLRVAKWEATMRLVGKSADHEDGDWPGTTSEANDEPAETHYARFLVLVLGRLRTGAGVSSMMSWLRDALADGRDEDVCWVLFHTLMYLQLESMRFNKTHAPLRDLADYYAHRVVVGPRSLFGGFSRVCATRRGMGES